MSINESHEKPGISLPESESQEIIKSFRSKYIGSNDLPNWKGNKLPAWCKFKKEIESKPASIEIFNEKAFGHEELLYIYFEFSNDVRRGNIKLFRRYFFEKPAWISNDVYIFPEKMNWCLVCDHDDNFSIYFLKN